MIRKLLKTDLESLSIFYASDFWSGAWKEWVVYKGVQYGTYDAQGQIYPETRNLLSQLGVSPDEAGWEQRVWEQAPNVDGMEQFWTLEAAKAELVKFTAPIINGGYGGEILVIDEQGIIQGMAAYCVLNLGQAGIVMASRFTGSYCSAFSKEPVMSDQLMRFFTPDGSRIGIFLDFAITTRFRSNGLGSVLFKERLDRMIGLGAEVVWGRTTMNSPRQFQGNYLKHGFVVAGHTVGNPQQVICVKHI